MGEVPTLDAFLAFTGLDAATSRAERECARHAFAEVGAAFARPEGADPIDWDSLEQAVYAHNERWSRETVRAVLIRLLHWWEPSAPVALPSLSLLARSRPVDPPMQAGDTLRAARFETLLTRWWSRLPALFVGDEAHAAAATLVTALLRLDVHDNESLGVLAHAPLPSLDMTEPDAGSAPRHLLEPLTALCVRRVRQRWPRASSLIALAPDALERCAGECALLLDDGTSGARAIYHVLQLAAAWRRRRLPRLLLDRPDVLKAVALDAPSWNRFAFGLGTPRETVAALPPPDLMRTLEGAVAQRPDPVREVQELRALAKKLNPDNKARTRRPAPRRPAGAECVLAARAALPWSALGGLVLSWLHHRLVTPKGPSSRSVARYLSALMPVVEAQGHEPVVSWTADGEACVDADAWEAMLGRLLPLRDEDTRSTLWRFHRDITRRHPAFAEVDLDVLGPGASKLTRAHDVDPDAFEAAMERVWSMPDPWSEQAALMGAFAYYAGLRKSESRFLRCVDIVDDTSLLLCVRATHERPLKSAAARRDVPLRALLPAHWSHRLQAWLARMRAVDSRSAPALLFADPARPWEPPPLKAFDQCMAAVRTVTGDGHLVFHSLRHAFATRAYLRLMLHACPALRSYPIAAFSHHQFDPAAIADWRAQWMAPAEAERGTHDLHALAALLGHSSVRVTFRNYIHAHDVIDRALAGFTLPEPPRSALACLTGDTARTSRATIERGRALGNRVAPNADWPSLWALLHVAMRRVTPTVVPSPAPGAVVRRPAALRVGAVPSIAAAVQCGSSDPRLAERLDVRPELVEALRHDLAQGRSWKLPREGIEQRRFARAAAQADQERVSRLTVLGCEAWRHARIARTTRPVIAGGRLAAAVIAAVAPMVRASDPRACVAIEVISDGVEPRAERVAAQHLQEAARSHEIDLLLRRCTAADVSWGRPPRCPDPRTPWVLIRVGIRHADGTFNASCGLSLAVDAFALLVTTHAL